MASQSDGPTAHLDATDEAWAPKETRHLPLYLASGGFK